MSKETLRNLTAFFFIISVYSVSAQKSNTEIQESHYVKSTETTSGFMHPTFTTHASIYSSKFIKSNFEYTKQIKDICYSWDCSLPRKSEDLYADNVILVINSQYNAKGKEDVLTRLEQRRNAYSVIETEINNCMSVKNTETDENWICVCKKENGFFIDGTLETNTYHELYRINKEGKIDFIKQYTTSSHHKD